MRIEVAAPGTVETVLLDDGDEHALLIGRQPDPKWVKAGPSELRHVEIVARPIASPGISSNHAIIWRDRANVRVMDLGSRNGTWVRLVPFEAATMSVPARLEVRLSLPSSEAPPEPRAARWTSVQDFDRAVADAVNQWLDHHKIPAKATLSGPESLEGPMPGRFPLPGETVLNVVSTQTASPEWFGILAVLWRYVDTQRRILQAEEVARQEGLILASEAIRAAHREVVAAARGGLRLLLLGPTGAGKEGLARAFHSHSGRPGPFVALNCSELNKEMLRAELFGAEDGSFTGAVRKIIGAVEHANGGTLFLDEIGELPLDVQPMLLRFLDRGEYTRMGNQGRIRHSDARIVCATNRDLRQEVHAGRFREDLWFRLSILVVNVSGLRDRFEDVQAFLQQAGAGPGSVWGALTEDAVDVLRRHPWDGNFRELTNFAVRLTSAGLPEQVDAERCRRTLAAGSLRPLPSGRELKTTQVSIGWEGLSEEAMRRASEAYAEDHSAPPASWNDVKDLIENYLKPVLFAKLSGTPDSDAVDPRPASRLGADRGTAQRQVERYFERFIR